MVKNHKIKKSKGKVTILPEASFVERLELKGNNLKFKMKSGDSVYSTVLNPDNITELLSIATEGGSLGTFYNTVVRKLPIDKVAKF
jgi:hypothetical protein